MEITFQEFFLYFFEKITVITWYAVRGYSLKYKDRLESGLKYWWWKWVQAPIVEIGHWIILPKSQFCLRMEYLEYIWKIRLQLASTENKSLPRNWLKLVLDLMGSPYLFEDIQQGNKKLCCSCCRLFLTKLLYLDFFI